MAEADRDRVIKFFRWLIVNIDMAFHVVVAFFAIGIIASVRRILLIEAQTSLVDHMPREKMIEMGLSAVIILVLVIAYYISVKAQKLEE